jgi:beta-N-acetylhexosaminidase
MRLLKKGFTVCFFLMFFIGASHADAMNVNHQSEVGRWHQQCMEKYQVHQTLLLGQRLIVGFKGKVPSDSGVKDIKQLIQDKKVGGVILLSRNIESKSQLKALIQSLVKENPCLIVAIDQEGGPVQRLTADKGFKGLISASAIKKKFTPQQAFHEYSKMAAEMIELGINLNFAPVVDISLNPHKSRLDKQRMFSDKPDEVVEYAASFLKACQAHNLLCVLKHYPGLGSSHVDSHHQTVDITDLFKDVEHRPYERLHEQGLLSAVMLSHAIDRNIDDLPVSLSSFHVKKLKDMNKQVITISDSFTMKAISDHFSLKKILAYTKASGIDWLLWVDPLEKSSSVTTFVNKLHSYQ